MALGCKTLQGLMVCAPAAAAPAVAGRNPFSPSSSSSFGALKSKWVQRVSLKASFMHSVLQHDRTASHVVRQVAVSQLSDFAVQESAKFREGLLLQLEGNPTTASHKSQIADVCTKIFGDYVDKYDGSLSPEPFGEMKENLDSQNLPRSELVICAALGWSRGHLYHDWKMSMESK